MRTAGFLTVAVAVALVGCGAALSSTEGSLPSPLADTAMIEVSADSELARMLAPGTPAQLFVASEGLDYPVGQAGRWNAEATPATADEVLALAGLLGVSGEVTGPDDGLGPGLMVGSPQSTDGALLVSSFSDPFWNLQRSDFFLAETGAFPCTTLPFDDANAGQCADGTAPSTPSAPTDSVVESTIAELMEAMGVGSNSYRTETFPFGSVAETRIEFSPDGLRSDVSWSVAVSINGNITSGSGPLRPPVLVDDVPTVPLDDALLRLSRIAPATAVVPTTTLSSPAIDPADIAVVTPPPPTTAPLPVVLPTITGVEAGLASVWDVDNRLWLVPAIVVTGDNGFVASIPTISADLVTIVSPDLVDVPVRTGPPLTVPAPLPTAGESGPVPTGPQTQTTPAPNAPAVEPQSTLPVPPGPDTAAQGTPAFYTGLLNELLVGQPLDGAWVRLLDAGWEVRVDDLDDPTESFDADLRSDRVTIEHRGITVVAVTVG